MFFRLKVDRGSVNNSVVRLNVVKWGRLRCLPREATPAKLTITAFLKMGIKDNTGTVLKGDNRKSCAKKRLNRRIITAC
jgi:hypothetical protein